MNNQLFEKSGPARVATALHAPDTPLGQVKKHSIMVWNDSGDKCSVGYIATLMPLPAVSRPADWTKKIGRQFNWLGLSWRKHWP